MTLKELRYVVAVAAELHFGRAAARCFISQPALSLAVQKLEEELGVKVFERSKNDLLVTTIGARIVEQAQRALREVDAIAELARGADDQLVGTFRLGVISTVGPYLLSDLVPLLRWPTPSRRIGLAWRTEFPRPEAIDLIAESVARMRQAPAKRSGRVARRPS